MMFLYCFPKFFVLATFAVSSIVHLVLFVILFRIYLRNARDSAFYLSVAMLGLCVFSLSSFYEGLFGLNNFVFCLGGLAGITGVFFSLLFWESARSRRVFGKVTLLGASLMGFSQASLIMYCVNRPSWLLGKVISGTAQFVFYLYIFLVVVHTLYSIRRFTIHDIIRSQIKLLYPVAFMAYGGVILVLMLDILGFLDWRYVFILLMLLTLYMTFLYIKKPVVFLYLPESLFELRDFKLEKVMLTMLNGELIWSSGNRNVIKGGLEDELLSNLIAALELFGREVLNAKPQLNIMSLKIDDKLVFIRRYKAVQCVVIANKMVKPLRRAIMRFIKKAYKIIPVREFPKLSMETIKKVNEVYEEEFEYILMFLRKSGK